MVNLTKGFWMDKWEVTTDMFVEFLKEYGDWVDEEGHPLICLREERCQILWGPGSAPDPGWGEPPVVKAGCHGHPVVFVTWVGAAKFAQHYGLALPTEAQWEYATRGGGGDYPRGNGWREGFYPVRDKDDPALQRDVPATYPVAYFHMTSTWCGVECLIGNAWEWCADWYAENYYRQCARQGVCVDPAGPASGRLKVMRGGGWQGDAESCRSTNRNASGYIEIGQEDEWHGGDVVGFRCVAVVKEEPQPAPITPPAPPAAVEMPEGPAGEVEEGENRIPGTYTGSYGCQWGLQCECPETGVCVEGTNAYLN